MSDGHDLSVEWESVFGRVSHDVSEEDLPSCSGKAMTWQRIRFFSSSSSVMTCQSARASCSLFYVFSSKTPKVYAIVEMYQQIDSLKELQC